MAEAKGNSTTQDELLAREDVASAMAGVRGDPQNAGKRFRVVETPAGFVIIRNPSKPQWNLFRTILWDEDKAQASRSMEGLVVGMIVHPDKGTVAQLGTDYVGLWDNPDVVLEVRRHCGHASEAHAK